MTETPQKRQSADLGLRPGMAVEVMNAENRLMRVTRVESYNGDAVILRDAKGDSLPRVVYNQEVKLRFFRDGDSSMIQGKICGSTEQIWKIDRMEQKFAREQRAFFRQQISTSVLCKVHRCTSRGAVSKEGYFGRVMDVSAGGLMLLSTEHYAKGDRLAIIGIELTKTTAPFNFYCQVRRASPRKDGTVCYGCQFESLHPKEQDRLLQAIFAMQREEIRRQKEQGGK